LFAAEILLRRLDAHVTEQKVKSVPTHRPHDTAATRSAQVVWRQVRGEPVGREVMPARKCLRTRGHERAHHREVCPHCQGPAVEEQALAV
jgi:hypothetical protein